MHFVPDMCCALDMPCGARGGLYRLVAKGDISNGCNASIYRVCQGANISTKGVMFMENSKNRLREDSLEFAIAVSNACDNIKGCSVFVNQLLRASSSIGANIHEARYAQSRADYISKLEIALKESSETDYWLELLWRKGTFAEEQYRSMRNQCGSIRRRFISSITTTKANKEDKYV